MNDMLIGALITSIFFIWSMGIYYLGKNHKTNKRQDSNEYIQKELRKRQQGMQNILDYDVDVAMGNRKQRGYEE